jgi:flagellar hook-associated protein 1 FlgK
MPVNLSSVGLSGINAAEAEIAVVESNITNASNPNYSVESANLAAIPAPDGAGGGVEVLGTQRAQAPFLTSQINSAQSTESLNASFAQVAQAAQTLLAPSSGADLGQAMQSMFNAFTNLSASPEDPTVRQSAIAAAGTFAQTAQQVSSQLASEANGALGGLSSLVAQVNQISSQIADLNSQITAQQARGNDPAALLDRRDGLVSQLSQLIGASADSQGNVSVNGVPLVFGANALTLGISGTGASTGLEVSLANGNQPIPTGSLGGQIGGLLSGVAAVNQVRASFDSLVTSIASAINTQHAAGYGLDGSTGNVLFLIPGTSSGPIELNPAINVQNLAAASSAAGLPGDGSNASAIAALGQASGLDAAYPGSTFIEAFAQLQSDFGSLVQAANNNQQQAAATVQSLSTLKGSITGVSLNDQLTKLIEYQSALEAAGRAVQAVNDMATFLVQEVQ